jgi:hypothetical protein
MALALVVIGAVLRFSYAADELAWALAAIVLPFSAVFYPVAALPGWAQTAATIIPPAHLFEAMRGLLAGLNPHGATCGRPACSMWTTWGRRSLSRASCSVRSDVAEWFPGTCNSLRLGAGLRDFGLRRQDQFPQVQAPQPQPPLDAVGAGSVFAPAAVANENRRRTRSLPQFGHATSTWTVEPIGRRSSNGRSQPRQMYS